MRHIEVFPDIFGTLCNSCTCSCGIFRTLAHLDPEAFSKACQTCKVIRHIDSPGIGRTVIQVFSRIFRDIQGYSGGQLGGSGEGLPCPFLEIEKSALISEKRPSLSIFG